MTQNLREKFSSFILLFLGAAWGNWWITVFLSCPEWWYIAINALLFACGILVSRLLDGSWKQIFPAMMLPLVLLLDHYHILYTMLMPLVFGIWYGGDENISRCWRISRTFCGGMIIGGVVAGIFPFQAEYIPLFAALNWLYCGITFSFFYLAEALLGSIIFFRLFLPLPEPEPPGRIEPGTVISAFSLAGERKDHLPLIIFIGGNRHDIIAAGMELDPAAWIITLPELPGSVPEKSSLIIAAGLPETGDGGAASLYRSLADDGILVLPVKYTSTLPELKWYILPGSDGNFAAASPAGEITPDPDSMDDRLASHFRNANREGPAHGALAGMLHDYQPEILSGNTLREKNMSPYWIAGSAAFLLLAGCAVHHRRRNRDTGRIIINCTGYTLLAAFAVPEIFAGLPTVISLHGLTAIIAVMWIFRRPVDDQVRRPDARFSGMLSLLALIAARNGGWIFSSAALVFGGYSFCALDNELCGKRDENTEAVRCLGFALGAMAAFCLQNSSLPAWSLFAAAVILRFWSWFRN